MNTLKLMIAGILLPASALASDASQPDNAWTQEPTSFMGVDLHGDFLKEVAECPADISKPETLCRVATQRPDQYLVLGTDSRRVLLGYQLIAQLSGDKLEKLIFTGPSNSSSLVAEMLRTDYGPPSHSRTNLVKTRSGASFDNEVLRWKGENLSIESARDDADLGTYNVMFNTAPLSLSNVKDAEQSPEPGVSQI